MRNASRRPVYVSTLHGRNGTHRLICLAISGTQSMKLLSPQKKEWIGLQECARILGGKTFQPCGQPSMASRSAALPKHKRRRIKTKFGDKQIYVSLREELQKLTNANKPTH